MMGEGHRLPGALLDNEKGHLKRGEINVPVNRSSMNVFDLICF
jgi:hypothetical protein